jgi:hypothetical protein
MDIGQARHATPGHRRPNERQSACAIGPMPVRVDVLNERELYTWLHSPFLQECHSSPRSRRSARAPPSERRSFQDPPDSAKPRVWWHWMNGNITKEGIKLDLECKEPDTIGLEAAKRAAAPLRRSGEPWVQIVPIRGR